MTDSIEIVVTPQEVDLTITPIQVNVEVADPSKVGEAGATPVSAEINNDNKLDFLMSDGRHVVVDDYSFVSGSASGWAQYFDTQYTEANPLVVTNHTEISLPNNAGTKIETYLPDGVSSFYNATTQKVTPNKVGDYNIFTVRLKAKTAYSVTNLDFSVDIGGTQGKIFHDLKVFPRGAGIEHALTFICTGFSLNTFVANGGTVKIKPVGGDVYIYNIEYQIVRVHSS